MLPWDCSLCSERLNLGFHLDKQQHRDATCHDENPRKEHLSDRFVCIKNLSSKKLKPACAFSDSSSSFLSFHFYYPEFSHLSYL